MVCSYLKFLCFPVHQPHSMLIESGKEAFPPLLHKQAPSQPWPLFSPFFQRCSYLRCKDTARARKVVKKGRQGFSVGYFSSWTAQKLPKGPSVINGRKGLNASQSFFLIWLRHTKLTFLRLAPNRRGHRSQRFGPSPLMPP